MPEARLSALTTVGYLILVKNFLDELKFLKTPNFAVGILYLSQIFLVKIFDPSSLAADLFGPKTLILFFSKKSTIPSTSGFSGPTIIKSIPCLVINSFNSL